MVLLILAYSSLTRVSAITDQYNKISEDIQTLGSDFLSCH